MWLITNLTRRLTQRHDNPTRQQQRGQRFVYFNCQGHYAEVVLPLHLNIVKILKKSQFSQKYTFLHKPKTNLNSKTQSKLIRAIYLNIFIITQSKEAIRHFLKVITKMFEYKIRKNQTVGVYHTYFSVSQ